MGSAPSAPTPTDPNVVAANQQTLNTKSGEQSQAGSMVNQNTATGSLSYNQTGTSPDGTPLYTANTTLSPQQQQLLNTLTGTQDIAGAGGQALMAGANYGSEPAAKAIGDATSGLTGAAVAQEQQYLQPFFKPQVDQLDTQLRNQGFDPSSPAYKQAMNNLLQSQGQTETGFVANIEPQMFQQATATYELPAQLGGSLAQFAAPTNPNFVQTPQLSVNPADLTGATASYNTAQQAAYNSQMQQYQSMISGIMGVPTAILGGLAKGGSLGGLSGLFSGGAGAAAGSAIPGAEGATSIGSSLLGAMPLVL